MTGLLLDTQTLLWFLESHPRLRAATRKVIEEAPEIYVSSVSIWEITIKRAKGALKITPDYRRHIDGARFLELSVTFDHAQAIEHLPPIHKDPFDRLLIAQAQCENLTIITSDAHMLRYPVKTLHA
jgi:PIN domain nuclease of toxin-antitoxin system